MQQIKDFIEMIKNIEVYQVIDIFIAVLIYIAFRLFSGGIAYVIVRIFKPKVSSVKKIKETPFYEPVRIFITVLGAYLAILFLKVPLQISEIVMIVVTKIFKIISIFVFARGLANSFKTKGNFVNKMREKSNANVDDSMFNFILKAIRFIIYAIAVFLIALELGYNLNGLVAGLGIGGIIITLAAQDTAKNLFGGAVIFLDKPFVVGDWIQMDNYEGTVEDITFRSTRIRTFENAVVNIPNSIISNSSIINWSRMEKRRYKVDICLELNTPLEKVEKVSNRIHNMLEQHDEIIDESIMVKFDKITEKGINLLVYSYTNSVDYASFITEKEKINYRIMQILREENIELAYDTKTIYVKN